MLFKMLLKRISEERMNLIGVSCGLWAITPFRISMSADSATICEYTRKSPELNTFKKVVYRMQIIEKRNKESKKC